MIFVQNRPFELTRQINQNAITNIEHVIRTYPQGEFVVSKMYILIDRIDDATAAAASAADDSDDNENYIDIESQLSFRRC